MATAHAPELVTHSLRINQTKVSPIPLDRFIATVGASLSRPSMPPSRLARATDAAIDAAVKMTLEVGPLSRVLADQPDDIRARASAAVRAAFEGRAGERSVMINGATWIVTARNPAS